MHIITTVGLTKKFNKLVAVDNISFTVDRGEIFGFLGPNGAGKTTTIKMLTTLMTPTEGSAAMAGSDIITQRAQVRKSIGVVFQEPALDTELTGYENLDYHARMYGIPRSKRQRRISEVLHLVDLQDKKNVLVKQYSGGMKRRLEIARGLMHSPKVLFLDEPTVGIDPQSRNNIYETIEDLRNRGMTILYTTHYMEEANRLCDRVAIMDGGQIIAMDTPYGLKSHIGPPEQVTLEDVFLKLTGRSLRD